MPHFQGPLPPKESRRRSKPHALTMKASQPASQPSHLTILKTHHTNHARPTLSSHELISLPFPPNKARTGNSALISARPGRPVEQATTRPHNRPGARWVHESVAPWVPVPSFFFPPPPPSNDRFLNTSPSVRPSVLRPQKRGQRARS